MIHFILIVLILLVCLFLAITYAASKEDRYLDM